MKNLPAFIITIDTEGDNLWSRPERNTTKNSEYLPRFQELCEKYNFKPTYLTNYEMAKSRRFQEFGRDILERNTGEIGMHLHAWDMPPNFRLTSNDLKFHPYLIEYPEEIIREKVRIMTGTLEDVFQEKMVSHRAGRWGFNEIYAKVLIENGYKVDCSVTPLVSWQLQMGDPSRKGGTDYKNFPSEPYFVDLNDISLPGESLLLELPMTIVRTSPPVVDTMRSMLRKIAPVRRMIGCFFEEITWFRPKIDNLSKMKKVVLQTVNEGKTYIEFMIHSSELMPGGSPNFKTKESIETLYSNLEQVFGLAYKSFQGCTMKEFHARFMHADGKNMVYGR